MANNGETMETVTYFIFFGSKITADGNCSHEIKRRLVLERKARTNQDSIKKQRHHFANKGPSSQSYGFPNNHVEMWELDHKEGWAPHNWCLPTTVLKKTLGSPLDCKQIKPVNHKGNQPWIFTGRTDDEAPILWPPNAKSQLTGKDPDAGKDWRQKKGIAEDEMVGWRHRLNGHESEPTLGDTEGQGSLPCCTLRSCKESDTLNNGIPFSTAWLSSTFALLFVLKFKSSHTAGTIFFVNVNLQAYPNLFIL